MEHVVVNRCLLFGESEARRGSIVSAVARRRVTVDALSSAKVRHGAEVK